MKQVTDGAESVGGRRLKAAHHPSDHSRFQHGLAGLWSIDVDGQNSFIMKK